MEVLTVSIWVVLLTILLFLTIVTYGIYSGLLYSVQVGAGKPAIKSVQFAYKFGRGPYKDTSCFFTEATSIAPKYRCLGVYYDDPYQVPSHKLRWAVGSILSEGDEAPDVELVKLFKTNGFSTFRLPEVSNVVRTTFPARTSLSVLIGIFKVYPLLGEYVRINKLCAHPWMEVYDGKTIYYMAPLAKQDEFYVPESLEEEYPNDDQDAFDDDVMEPVAEEPEPEEEVDKSSTANGISQRARSEKIEGWEGGDRADLKQCPAPPTVDTPDFGQFNGACDMPVKEALVDAADCGGRAPLGGAHDSNGLEAVVLNGVDVAETPRRMCGGDASCAGTSVATIQDGGVSSSTPNAQPPSPAFSVDSSRLSVETESSNSAYYYTSQSEYTPGGASVQPDILSSASTTSTATKEFSSDSDSDRELDLLAVSRKDGERVS